MKTQASTASSESLENRKRWLLVAVLFTVIVIAALLFYSVTRSYIFDQAERRIQDVMLESRALHWYVQRNMHPAVYKLKAENRLPEDFYAPEILSSSYIARNLYAQYNKQRKEAGLPEIRYRLAALNPRNELNQADEFEAELIRKFNEDESLTEYREIVEIDGRQHLYYAQPFLQVNEACLKCHGTPGGTPAELRDYYDWSGGYGRKVGEVVALESISSPLEVEYTASSVMLTVFLTIGGVLSALLFVNRRLSSLAGRHTRALAESEERYRTLVENIDLGIAQIDADYRVVMANGSQGRLLHKRVSELLGRKCHQELGKRQEVCPRCPGARAMETGKPAEEKSVLVRENGRRIPVRIQAFPVQQAGGTPSGFIEVVEDISASREMEAERDRLAAILDSTSDLVGTATPGGALQYINQAGRKMLNWSPNQSLEGLSAFDTHPQWANDIIMREAIPTAIREGAWRGETALLTSDGREIPVSQVVMAHRSSSGEVEHLSTVTRDISELKQAEADLREARQEWEDIFHAIGQPAVILDVEQGIVAANETVVRMSGESREQLRGKRCWEVFHGKDVTGPPPRCPFEQMRHSKHLQTVEMEQEALGGYYLVSCTPVHNEQGNLKKVIHIATDISGRKQAEDALRESEERFRATFEQAAVGIAHVAPDGTWLRVNQRLCNIVGYADEELRQLTFQDITHPDDLDADLEYTRQMLADEIRTYSMEKRHIRKDGGVVWIDLTVSLIREPTGEPKYFIAVVEDIAERKQAEDALRESEERFRAIFDQAAVGVAQIETATGRFVKVNQKYCDIVGTSAEKLAASTFMDITHANDIQTDLDNMERIKTGETRSFSQEKRYLHPDGSAVWVNITVSPMWAIGEEPTFHITVVEDVTERMAVEQQLRESETRFRELFGNMTAGVAVYEAKDNGEDFFFKDMNEAGERLSDIRRDDIIGKSVLEVFPGVRDMGLFDVLQRVWRTGTPEEHPTAYYEDERLTRWYENRVYRLPSGEIVALYADATERKRAELELERTKALLQAAIEACPAGIMIADAPDVTVRTLNAAAQYLGQGAPDGLVGAPLPERQRPWQVLHLGGAELTPDEFPIVRAVRNGETISNEELVVRQADGRERFLLVNAAPVRDALGKVVAGVAVFPDITDHRRAEQAVQAAQRQLLDHQRHETERAQVELNRLQEQLVNQTRLATIGQVAGSIAHELRNPLGAARNAAFYLSHYVAPTDPKLGEHLTIIEEEIKRADRIITDLMDMVRSRPPNREVVDLGKLVHDVLGRLSLGPGIQFQLQLNPDPFLLDGDARQFDQVIANLVSNAAQALQGVGEITITAARSQDCDELVVCDNGPGIAPEVRNRVFDALFTTKAKGTGLGLTICREIIQRHGGTLDLVAHDRPGAAFRITLPHVAAPVP